MILMQTVPSCSDFNSCSYLQICLSSRENDIVCFGCIHFYFCLKRHMTSFGQIYFGESKAIYYPPTETFLSQDLSCSIQVCISISDWPDRATFILENDHTIPQKSIQLGYMANLGNVTSLLWLFSVFSGKIEACWERASNLYRFEGCCKNKGSLWLWWQQSWQYLDKFLFWNKRMWNALRFAANWVVREN